MTGKGEKIEDTEQAQPFDYNAHTRSKLGEFETDEEYGAAFDKMHSEHSELSGFKKDFEEKSAVLTERMAQNPEFAAFMQAAMEGEPLVVCCVEAGIEEEDIAEAKGETGYDRARTKHAERIDKRKRNEEHMKEIGESAKMSAQEIEAFSKETFGDNADEAEAFADFVDNIIHSALIQKIDRNFLTRMHQAFTYKEDVAEAAETGRVAGKNENIVAHKKKGATKDDGLPDLNGKGAAITQNVSGPQLVKPRKRQRF